MGFRRERGIYNIFDEAYTEAVYSKLKWNWFDLSDKQEHASYHDIRVPKCIKNSSFKRFKKGIKKNNENEAEIAWKDWNYTDEQAEVDEAIRNEDFNTTHPVMKMIAKKES